MKQSVIILTIFSLLLSFAEASAAAPESKKPAKGQAEMIRIMQFNILQGKGEPAGHKWAEVRKDACIKMFEDIDPDIVCMQEARRSQCEDLADELNQYSQVKMAKDGIESNGGQRNVIMYKWKNWSLISADRLWFSVDRSADGDRFGDPLTTQKMLMWVHLKHKKTKKDVWVFDAHFFANCERVASRDSCVAITLNTIRKVVPEDGVCFFCGDLNIDWSKAAARTILQPVNDYMSSASLDAANGDSPLTPTYNKFTPSYKKVLDYIFYRNVKGFRYKVVNEAIYGTDFISDHYPIYLDFIFE